MSRKCFTHNHRALMRKIWSFLISSSMAFLLAILAMVAGYYQFYLSRPILEYSSATDKIISTSSSEGINLHINGNDYKDIYRTVVSLINNGEEALSGSDVSPLEHDPIRIPIPPQVKILYYNINYENTSPEVDAQLLRIKDGIAIKFSYLNPGNSIAVNLFSEQDYNQFKIVGSAAGVNKITQTLSHRQTKKIIIFGILGIIIFYALFSVWYFHRHRKLPRI